MRLVILIWTSFLYSCYSLIGQSYCDNRSDYIWILGGDDDTIKDEHGGCEINFNFDPPGLFRHSKPVMSPFQNAVVSTNQGDLLFYSNGCIILNAHNELIENGDTLNPGEIHDEHCPYWGYSGSQNMIIIPRPLDSSMYFVFHIDKVFNYDTNPSFLVLSEHLYMTTVDMSNNNGLGEVIEKNKIIIRDTSLLGGPLTAVKHANGNDWWLITPKRWSNSFVITLIDEYGANLPLIQVIGDTPDSKSTAGQGKFSPDGKVFAWFHPRNGLFLYDFDREEGKLSNFRKVVIPPVESIVGGLEFSPSGRFIYISQKLNLYQIDLNSTDIQESLTHIADFDGFGDPLPTLFFFMERTPDKRIIMNVLNGSQYLHVIQEPDKKGVACRFEQHVLKLPTVNNFTLPHFPNYRLGAFDEPLCDSMKVSIYHDQNNFEQTIQIHPNPVVDYMDIIDKDGNYLNNITTTVYKLTGEVVEMSKLPRIFLGHLSPGIYICQIEQNNATTRITKIVVL